ncbi:hypothetical protein M404DRAFT_36654 [Pisolithus tinctorius Marx 270]|uniref:Uncharacterized protein n=1 Tax=Pisolithus tinctorius Marx 270 TaxID=870435 RepID=A0A0C3MVC5_PISTI|nr:hypothetical protein M404DRAFT_36654 [Pisolithus tinctorius Marx 270]
MSSQCQSKTPQPTPGHVCNYSQVMDEELVILTDDSTDTKQEKECKAECKAKRWKTEEEWLEAEQRKRVEEEAQRRAMEEEEARKKRVAEEEAERQRQRSQARQDEAVQRLSGMVYNVNTAKRVPGTSVVVTATRRAP